MAKKFIHTDEYFGQLTLDDECDWIYTKEFIVPCLNNSKCRFVLSSIDSNAFIPEQLEKYKIAVNNFLLQNESLWNSATPHLVKYCLDSENAWNIDDSNKIKLENVNDIWDHARLTHCCDDEPTIIHIEECNGDENVYLSIEGGCDWEIEHGLNVVIKNGVSISKIGPYDGHVTNEHAFNNIAFRNVVYVSGDMIK